MAQRFCDTYLKYPANYPHTLVIVCNDPNWNDYRHVFSQMPCMLVEGDNVGWDIGAFQKVAQSVEADLMVFFGSTAYLTRSGWLKRMVESYEKHGFGIYGALASGADPKSNVYTHIRTTGFWMHPSLLKSYPYSVASSNDRNSPDSRYSFEHGKYSITNWVLLNGGKVILVTWIGEYEVNQWSLAQNSFHNGNQSALIVRDRLCDPPYYPL